MWRHVRIDRPNRRRPLARRLAIQCLEERLTLSATADLEILTTTFDIDSPVSGGFVDVGGLARGVTFSGDEARPLLNNSGFGSFLLFDSSGSVLPTIAEDGDFEGIIGSGLNQLGGDFDSDDIRTSDLEVKVIPPPEFLPPVPEGGLIEISELTRISDPQASEIALLKSEAPTSLATKPIHEVTLNRGRDISFQVASLSPPGSITNPTRVTSEAVQTKALSRGDAGAPLHEADASVDEIIPSTAQSSANVIFPGSQPTEAMQPSHRMSPANGPVSKTPARSEVSINRDVVTDRSDADDSLLSSQPKVAGSEEEEVRSRVFADWRNRDLLAVPVLIALAASPRLARRHRGLCCEIQQLPPQRGRQTLAL